MDGAFSPAASSFYQSDAHLDPATCQSPILRRLAETIQASFPFARVQSGARGFTVLADTESGFSVSAEDAGGGRYVLYAGPGMFEVEDAARLNRIVMLACSSVCRLSIKKAGDRTREWSLERMREGQWQPILQGGASHLFSFAKSRWLRFQNMREPIGTADARAA